jgi:predicted DNA-binding ribbon-helix-helix protein
MAEKMMNTVLFWRKHNVDDLIEILRCRVPNHQSISPADGKFANFVRKCLREVLDSYPMTNRQLADVLDRHLTGDLCLKLAHKRNLGSYLRVCLFNWIDEEQRSVDRARRSSPNDDYDDVADNGYDTNSGTHDDDTDDDDTDDDPDEEPARNDYHSALNKPRW